MFRCCARSRMGVLDKMRPEGHRSNTGQITTIVGARKPLSICHKCLGVSPVISVPKVKRS